MNFFHIEELMQKLKENKEMLEKAIQILKDFKKAVDDVLDSGYNNDLFQEYPTLYSKYDNMKSIYLTEITQKRPIYLRDIRALYCEKVDKALSLDATLDEVTVNRIPTLLNRKLKAEFENDTSRILEIDSVVVTYQEILSAVCVTGMSQYMRDRKGELGGEQEQEQKAISATFTYIWQKRLKKLQEIVQLYSDKLTQECCEQLNIEIPTFQVAIGQYFNGNELKLRDLNTNQIGAIIKKAMEERNYAKHGAGDGIIGWFKRIFGHADKKNSGT